MRAGPDARRERGQTLDATGARRSMRAGGQTLDASGARRSMRAGPDARRERGQTLDASGARRSTRAGPDARCEPGQTLDASGAKRCHPERVEGSPPASGPRLPFDKLRVTWRATGSLRVVASGARRSTRAGPDARCGRGRTLDASGAKRCHPERVEGSPPASGPRLPFDKLRVTWRATGSLRVVASRARRSVRAGPDARCEPGKTLSSRACRGIATILRSAAALRQAQGDMEGTRGNWTLRVGALVTRDGYET
jgi:hypothetical protein